MKRLSLLSRSLCATMFVLAATSAYGQTFVSSTGSDANACTQAAPCATFQKAYSVLPSATGTILCLNSGQYSTTTLTVTASLTIDCGEGNIGRMDLTGGGAIAININLSGSSAGVTLRHLSINGVSGSSGIVTSNLPAGSLNVEDSYIKGFTGTGSNGYGILFTPSGSGRSSISVSNSKVQGNNIGISVAPASSQITSVNFTGDGIGGNGADGLDLVGAGVVAGVVRGTTIASSGSNGFVASSTGGVYLTLEDATISANLGIGIATNSANASVNVASSTIVGNGTAVKSFAGSLTSFGDNHISANGAPGAFTGLIPLQ